VQPLALCGPWKQRDASAEKHGDDGDFDGVDFAHGEKLSKECASAEEPDVFLALCAQGLQALWVQLRKDGRAGVIFRIECAGGDEGIHGVEGRLAEAREGGLVGAAAHEGRVELRPELGEVVFRIDDDPVGFAVWSGDEAIKAHGYSIADSAHDVRLLRRIDSIALLSLIVHVIVQTGPEVILHFRLPAATCVGNMT